VWSGVRLPVLPAAEWGAPPSAQPVRAVLPAGTPETPTLPGVAVTVTELPPPEAVTETGCQAAGSNHIQVSSRTNDRAAGLKFTTGIRTVLSIASRASPIRISGGTGGCGGAWPAGTQISGSFWALHWSTYVKKSWIDPSK